MTLEEKIKIAIGRHEQAFGSMCWSNGRSGKRELPNKLDGVLLKEIIKLIKEQ